MNENPCEECICLPVCVAKSNTWHKIYSSRFAYLTTSCEIAKTICKLGAYYNKTRRIMNEWWSQFDKNEDQITIYKKQWKDEYNSDPDFN